MIAKNNKNKKVSVSLSQGEKLYTKLAAFYTTLQTQCPVKREMIFGFDCLRINGKLFAKLHNGQLVIKLPANRITALLDSGQVSPYQLRGRLMTEWGIISTSKNIIALAEEARVFSEN